jgi:hypothetical protein
MGWGVSDASKWSLVPLCHVGFCWDFALSVTLSGCGQQGASQPAANNFSSASLASGFPASGSPNSASTARSAKSITPGNPEPNPRAHPPSSDGQDPGTSASAAAPESSSAAVPGSSTRRPPVAVTAQGTTAGTGGQGCPTDNVGGDPIQPPCAGQAPITGHVPGISGPETPPPTRTRGTTCPTVTLPTIPTPTSSPTPNASDCPSG